MGKCTHPELQFDGEKWKHEIGFVLFKFCVICVIYYLLAKHLSKAQNTLSTYITTENVLVRHDSYLPKTL